MSRKRWLDVAFSFASAALIGANAAHRGDAWWALALGFAAGFVLGAGIGSVLDGKDAE